MPVPLSKIATIAAILSLIVALGTLARGELLIAGVSFLFVSFALFVRERYKP